MTKAEVYMNGELSVLGGLGLVLEGKIQEKWVKNLFTKSIPVGRLPLLQIHNH
jgi:hypothetical protein